MTRLIECSIQVVSGPGGAPRAFTWQNRRRRVADILDTWLDTGRWWEGEPEKQFFRVEAHGGGLFELYRGADGRWCLYRVYD